MAGMFSLAGKTFKSYLGSGMHKKGMEWARETYGLGKGMGKLGRGLGLGYLAYNAITGFQEGGLGGAAKEVAHGAAEGYVLGQASSLLGAVVTNPIGLAMIGGAAVGAGMYAKSQFITKMQDRHRKFTQLEMGRPMLDPFGNMATSRQRSIMAMQQSKINGRSALGQEASLLYRPYHR